MTAKTKTMEKRAKGFSLKDQNGTEISLSELRGKRALLSFHPLAWTSVCALQMQSLEKNKRVFEKLNCVAFGLSVDSIPCKRAWARELKIKNTSLLADFWPHGKVAKNLGIFRAKDGFSERANIILDEKGKIIFMKIYPIRELPDIQEIVDFLKAMVS